MVEHNRDIRGAQSVQTDGGQRGAKERAVNSTCPLRRNQLLSQTNIKITKTKFKIHCVVLFNMHKEQDL